MNKSEDVTTQPPPEHSLSDNTTPPPLRGQVKLGRRQVPLPPNNDRLVFPSVIAHVDTTETNNRELRGGGLSEGRIVSLYKVKREGASPTKPDPPPPCSHGLLIRHRVTNSPHSEAGHSCCSQAAVTTVHDPHTHTHKHTPTH